MPDPDIFLLRMMRVGEKLHTLTCQKCGWAWHTEETARLLPPCAIVLCKDEEDCIRRSAMHMAPGVVPFPGDQMVAVGALDVAKAILEIFSALAGTVPAETKEGGRDEVRRQM